MAIEVKKYALRQSKDGTIISFVLHPHDDATELVTAPIGAVFNISYEMEIGETAVADDSRSGSEGARMVSATPPPPLPLGERIRTRAVLLCKDKDFQEWIRARTNGTGEPSEGNAKFWLTSQLLITSRSELATNVEAQKVFLELERQYRASPVQGQG